MVNFKGCPTWRFPSEMNLDNQQPLLKCQYTHFNMILFHNFMPYEALMKTIRT